MTPLVSDGEHRTRYCDACGRAVQVEALHDDPREPVICVDCGRELDADAPDA